MLNGPGGGESCRFSVGAIHESPAAPAFPSGGLCPKRRRRCSARTPPSPWGEGAPVRKLGRMRCFGRDTKGLCVSTSSVAARQLPLKGKPFQAKRIARQFSIKITVLIWRRVRDLNPSTGITGLRDFESRLFDHLSNPPDFFAGPLYLM